jgi:hypothetical protein
MRPKTTAMAAVLTAHFLGPVELSGRFEELVDEISAVVDGLGRSTWWQRTFMQEGERTAKGELNKLFSKEISERWIVSIVYSD